MTTRLDEIRELLLASLRAVSIREADERKRRRPKKKSRATRRGGQ